MQHESRLQPKEIHPSIQQALVDWSQFSADQSFLDTLIRDGEELGPLSGSLMQANAAWSQSTLLDRLGRDPTVMDGLQPLPPHSQNELNQWLRADLLISNSIIFRTFVSVVLGRTEDFVGALATIARRNRSQHFKAVLKLLRNEEVRRLRNAIGHGTFRAQMQVMEYSDKSHQRKISFRELDELNRAVFTIVLAGMAASFKWNPS